MVIFAGIWGCIPECTSKKRRETGKQKIWWQSWAKNEFLDIKRNIGFWIHFGCLSGSKKLLFLGTIPNASLGTSYVGASLSGCYPYHDIKFDMLKHVEDSCGNSPEGWVYVNDVYVFQGGISQMPSRKCVMQLSMDRQPLLEVLSMR